MKRPNSFKFTAIFSTWLWLGLFAMLPCLMLAMVSFLSASPDELISFRLTAHNYFEALQPWYLMAFFRSLKLALWVTGICLGLAYPFALITSQLKQPWQGLLLLLIIIPFWTSAVIRTYSMVALLKAQGLLNLFLGVFNMGPLELLYTQTAVMIGLVYNLLPFMILPLYLAVKKIDPGLIAAARDLGARDATIFRRILLPMTLGGIISGCILVFLPAMTLFYIPAILGGARSILIGNVIQQEFLVAQNWPLGAAISLLLTLVLLGFVYLKGAVTRNRGSENLA